MKSICIFTKLVAASAVIATGLTGCEVLSDPAFAQAMQNGSQQFVNSAQSQQHFRQCVQGAAASHQSGSDCLNTYAQDLQSQTQ